VLICAICAALSGLRGANTAESQAPALNHATRDGAYHSRDLPSKTELANRFADIKRGSWQIRATAAKFVPLPPDAPPEVRAARMKLAAAMHSYELAENQAQMHRDRLNLLIELTPQEAQRFEMLITRLAKMQATIMRLMQPMNETGDALLTHNTPANARWSASH